MNVKVTRTNKNGSKKVYNYDRKIIWVDPITHTHFKEEAKKDGISVREYLRNMVEKK